jgi:hypothetical protein
VGRGLAGVVVMTRTQILGSVSDMGSDEDVLRELEELDAEEEKRAQEERELAIQEAFNKKMARRDNKKLRKF